MRAFLIFLGLSFLLTLEADAAPDLSRPNIVFIMSDDQGWGQVGYRNHPHLKTPHLDAMAANGLRFDRFYAGASNCSPTRATVLTGRTNDRTGVETHGFPLRLQEKTIAQALQKIGYATGHFGKWHLNGLRGPGVPVLSDDTHHPGAFGFETWLTTTNFFDRDPILSREGEFEEFTGDSSEIIVDEALKFIAEKSKEERPSFSVIWYGTPHDPMVASDEDRKPFADLPEKFQHQYGELVAMDRSIGAMRKGLRELGIEENTIIWFCSDNGGLSPFGPETVGGLRGWKNTMYEGGLRVPGIVEWPAVITEARITEFPAGTFDMFPTIAEITGLGEESMIAPIDGISIRQLFEKEIDKRESPLGFRHNERGVIIDNNFKFLLQEGKSELYDLSKDFKEENNLAGTKPDLLKKMTAKWDQWNQSVEQSVKGSDYPSGKVDPNQPERRFWTDEAGYQPYLSDWADRPEYSSRLKPQKKKK